MTDLVSEMRQLVNYFDETSNAGCSLWSWMPSQQIEKKDMAEEGLNVDYVFERQPYPAELMNEACTVISYLLGYTTSLSNEDKAYIESLRKI